MKTNGQRFSTTPSGCILTITVLVGSLAAMGGCFGGALLFPDSNMATLYSIPFGGIGIAVGMGLGIVWSAFRKDGHPLNTELWWIGTLWALTVLTSYKMDCDIVFVPLQVLPVFLGIWLINHTRLRPKIPAGIRRCQLLYPITALLFLITSLFPPVTYNKWMPVERRPVYTESNPMPKFLFCNSPRLDASRTYAKLGVDSSQLLQEWLVIATGTGLLLVGFGTNRSRK